VCQGKKRYSICFLPFFTSCNFSQSDVTARKAGYDFLIRPFQFLSLPTLRTARYAENNIRYHNIHCIWMDYLTLARPIGELTMPVEGIRSVGLAQQVPELLHQDHPMIIPWQALH
jgi:hypothetical protein